MAAKSWTVTVDCADPARLSAFWQLALGYVPAPAPQGFIDWDEWFERCGVPEAERNDGAAIVDPAGLLPRISFLRVPEPRTVKNRLHLDLQIGGGRAEPIAVRWPKVLAAAEELIAAGAVLRQQHDLPDGTPDHLVLGDPEGNEFCVL